MSAPYLDSDGVQLYCGDALEVLRELPSESVNCIATSPPFYALRDYGVEGQIGLESTPEEWAARLVDVFREARRVLRRDGSLWVECGDSYVSGQGGRQSAVGELPPTTRFDRKEAGVKREGLPSSFGERDVGPRFYPTRETRLKPKDLLGQPFLLAFALRSDGWYWRGCNIWAKPNCLSGGTWLYARTQKGEMPQMLKDLVRLRPETVELWNGERWTQVTNWRPSPRDVQLEIEFRNGERVGCTLEHLWPTERGLLPADALIVGDVVEKCRLPEPACPAAFMEDAQIGYLIGLYLAEGSMSGQMVQLSSHADEVGERHARLTPIVEALHGSAYVWRDPTSKTATVNLNGPLCAAAIHAYVGGTNAHTKHLTPRAWSRSNWFLRSVLLGYLEGDGHRDEANERWRLGFCNNDALARDLRTIAARLGFSLRLKRNKTGWRGSLKFRTEERRQPDTQIVAIRKSRARKFWDVSVEDEPHTFALASGTLTHNCMPESAKDRCTVAHSYILHFSKSSRYFFDGDAISEPAAWERWGDQTVPKHEGTETAAGWIGPRSKHELVALGNRSTNGRKERTDERRGFDNRLERADGQKHPRSVWTIPTSGYPGAHFATWPPKLAERIILAGCPKDGTVLDCFAGSGTTLVVARRLGRHAIGIELNPAYLEMAKERLASWWRDPPQTREADKSQLTMELV